PLTPVVAALPQEGLHEDPARESEHGDEQVHLRRFAGDLDDLHAEVDLHLLPRPGLVASGRDVLRANLATHSFDGALDRPQARVDAAIDQEVAHHHCVPLRRAPKQPYGLRPGRLIETARTRSDLLLGGGAEAQVALHRVPRDPELARDRLATPALRP